MFRFLFRKTREIKRNTLILLVVILIFFVLFLIFRNQIKDFIEIFITHFGLFGIFITSMIMDTIIQPIGPGILVVTATFGGANYILVSLVAGVGSCCGGVFGYFIGKKIGSERFKKIFGSRKFEKSANLFEKYGVLAVIVGAISPIPYSGVCWTAGIYNMKFSYFLLTSLIVRIPRFFVVGLIGSLL